MARNKFEDLQGAMERARGRKADVASDLQRLGGRTRNDTVPDRTRGAASPLGAARAAEMKRRREEP